MKSLSLGRKLFIGGLILLLPALAAVGWFSYWKSGSALREIAYQNLDATAGKLAEMVGLVLEEEIKLAKDIAAGNATIDAATKVAKEGLEASQQLVANLDRKLAMAMKQVGQEYASLFVADPAGKIYADGSGEGKQKGISIAQREYFQSLVKANQPIIGGGILTQSTGAMTFPIAAPIPSADGKFIGCLGITVKLDFLNRRLSTIKIGRTGGIWLVDQSGLFLNHTDKSLILKSKAKDVKGLERLADRLAAREKGLEVVTLQDGAKAAAFAPVSICGWQVVAVQDEAELYAPVRELRLGVLIIAGVILILAGLAVWWATRRLSGPLKEVVSGLNLAADQVNQNAQAMAGASQELADSSSTQAASLEETAASLEEITAMTRSTADSAVQANGLMAEAKTTLGRAGRAMEEMSHSMGQIAEAGGRISKIVKSIDEIAFQTNLLALNAAVEAARAGEAGAGFAVVADEVRNLALRAAEAAKNTQGLIEETVGRINQGEGLVTRTKTEFVQLTAAATKVAALIDQMAQVADEQAQGIDQINQAVSQLDALTQRISASAGQTSTTAEDLQGQAGRLDQFVAQLTVTISGQDARTALNPVVAPPQPRPAKALDAVLLDQPQGPADKEDF